MLDNNIAASLFAAYLGYVKLGTLSILLMEGQLRGWVGLGLWELEERDVADVVQAWTSYAAPLAMFSP